MKKLYYSKSIKLLCLLFAGIMSIAALLYIGKTSAATTNVDTTLSPLTGQFTFYKDTGTTMNDYYTPSHGPNTATGINLGTY